MKLDLSGEGIVIKIEVRNNGIFSPGYPYNHEIDDYFKNLTPEFIKTYGLEDKTVLSINEHKNKTQQFDKKIHDIILKLSAFMIDFDKVGVPLINEYDRLVMVREELLKLKEEFEKKVNEITENFEFSDNTIKKLKEDITHIDEMIMYYDSQIVDVHVVNTDNFIEECMHAIETLNDGLLDNEGDYIHYETEIKKYITQLVDVKISVNNKSFPATVIRTMYEEWKKRPEPYFRNLVQWFKSEYENHWTYGESLMYGETLELETALIGIYNDVSDKWQSTVFKKYNFVIDKEIKTYSIKLLHDNVDISNDEFTYRVESKKSEILRKTILEVEGIFNGFLSDIRDVVPINKEQNFNKYKELVLEKIRYLIFNNQTGTDQSVISTFDSKINTLYADYVYVTTRHSEPLYWELLAKKDMYYELLSDLKHQLEKSRMIVSGGYVKNTITDQNILNRLEFYRIEKINLEKKIQELIRIKTEFEFERNRFGDEFQIITSKLIDNASNISRVSSEYILFFNDRISFFTQNISVTENDGIIDMMKGVFFKDLRNEFNQFIQYNSPILWFDIGSRDKLKQLYSRLMDIIEKNMRIEWDREFSHKILNIKKYDVYEYYINREVLKMFAEINKFLMDSEYIIGYDIVIMNRINDIKVIFDEYLNIAMDIKKNIKLHTNLFNYNDVIEFKISDGEEDYNNITETYLNILYDIHSFVYNKNIEYKNFDNMVENNKKIDQVWFDLEKRYV